MSFLNVYTGILIQFTAKIRSLDVQSSYINTESKAADSRGSWIYAPREIRGQMIFAPRIIFNSVNIKFYFFQSAYVYLQQQAIPKRAQQ